MTKSEKIQVLAGDLQVALESVVPDVRANTRKRKTFPLSLECGKKKGSLILVEARYGAREFELRVKGAWPAPAQIDGHLFRKVIEKCTPETKLEIEALPDAVCIRHGGSVTRLTRIDSGGRRGIQRKALPRYPRHSGPVEVLPDPIEKRVAWADTWAFSARVPMPQHRDRKRD